MSTGPRGLFDGRRIAVLCPAAPTVLLGSATHGANIKGWPDFGRGRLSEDFPGGTYCQASMFQMHPLRLSMAKGYLRASICL